MYDLPIAEKGQFICDQPPPYSEGAIARLQCPENHVSKIYPPHSRLVSEEGLLKWIPPIGFCLPVLYDLPVAEHGEFFNITAPPYQENDVSFLQCFEGYTSETTIRSTVVLKEGVLQWDPPSAACVPLLSTLPEAKQGQFRSEYPAPYRKGDVATLACLKGYATKTPLESKVVFQQGFLQWDPPTAECLPILYDLPASEHALYFAKEFPYFEGDIAYFEGCEEGYISFGETHSIATRIGDYLEWRPPGVTCWPFTNDLPVAEHGHFEGPPEPYLEDEDVELVCDEGYGSKTVQYSVLMNIEGVLEWVPPAAVCVPILETLPKAENGRVSCDEEAPYVEGNVARLTCQEGYVPKSVTQSRATRVGDRLAWVPDILGCVLDPSLKKKSFGVFWILLVVFLCVSVCVWVWRRVER